MRARVRKAPGVPQIRHITERATAPYLRADLHSLHQDLLRLTDAIGALAGRHEHLAGVVNEMDQAQRPILNAIASSNGTARLLRRELEALRADVEQRLAAVADQAAADSGVEELAAAVAMHADTQAWLVQRVETVRNEVLFEVRYGTRGAAADQTSIAAEIVNEAALNPADGNIRLNLGCGHLPLDGYVNVDMRKIDGVDVVAPIDSLPFEPGTVSEIFSAHTLEHFPQEQLTRTLLPYWRSLLRPGGTFRAVTPDFGSMAVGFASKEISFDDFRLATYGGQEYEGDFHQTGFTTASVVALLSNAGFVDATIVAEGRPNGSCLELEVSATRPAD